jgi:hypothetical protein
MNNDIHSKSPTKPLLEAAREIGQQASGAAIKFSGFAEDVAEDVTDATKDAGKCASDTAKEIYQSAKQKAEESLASSKAYVRRNPVPMVLGAFAFGAAFGCLLMMARRKPTFGERYADEPLGAVREAILGAIAPVTQRVHNGYDSAMDGAGRVFERVNGIGLGRCRNSISDQIGRIGSNLKFW